MSTPQVDMAEARKADSLKSARYERLRLLARSWSFIIGLVIVLFWVGCALFGSELVPQDPFNGDLLNTLLPPSADNWFGTDQLGRDVFSRVIVGARDILTIAPLATMTTSRPSRWRTGLPIAKPWAGSLKTCSGPHPRRM